MYTIRTIYNECRKENYYVGIAGDAFKDGAEVLAESCSIYFVLAACIEHAGTDKIQVNFEGIFKEAL